MSIILIVMKDRRDIDEMYKRNPNVTMIIYVFIMVAFKFILVSIFLSLVYMSYL